MSTRAELARRTRTLAKRLAELHPGRIIELRVPPFVAVQLGDGTGGVHTRGTPPNVVEMDANTLLGLASGQVLWADAIADGRIQASGSRSDLSAWFAELAASGEVDDVGDPS